MPSVVPVITEGVDVDGGTANPELNDKDDEGTDALLGTCE